MRLGITGQLSKRSLRRWEFCDSRRQTPAPPAPPGSQVIPGHPVPQSTGDSRAGLLRMLGCSRLFGALGELWVTPSMVRGFSCR